ncbi:hypothetical protein F2Q69_00047662 [Brassica cretica]|uniref:Uncharacterized protein n=1 Tax=Brassica cretica TaxID=69181 RepID=A0A8S9PJS7_BRACR|nr:hypothetical protein F2Q69_00047662 [Brassica cretica]
MSATSSWNKPSVYPSPARHLASTWWILLLLMIRTMKCLTGDSRRRSFRTLSCWKEKKRN